MKNRFIELRKILHLSQQEMGEKLGVTQSTISSIEIQRTPLTLQMINNICNTFNVNKLWLLNGTGEIFDNKSIVDKDFFNVYNQLSPNCQAFLLNCSKELLKLQDNL